MKTTSWNLICLRSGAYEPDSQAPTPTMGLEGVDGRSRSSRPTSVPGSGIAVTSDRTSGEGWHSKTPWQTFPNILAAMTREEAAPCSLPAQPTVTGDRLREPGPGRD